jgi:hypothetical protein
MPAVTKFRSVLSFDFALDLDPWRRSALPLHDTEWVVVLLSPRKGLPAALLVDVLLVALSA